MKWWLIGVGVIVLLPVVSFFILGMFSWKRPVLGLNEGKLQSCPASPNCVGSQSEKNDEHFIEPLAYSVGEGTINRKRLGEILQTLSRNSLIDESEDYFHYEFVSGIFRFADDVEFLFDDEHRVIHVRSASRVGHSDLGANRERIEMIRELFQTGSQD